MTIDQTALGVIEAAPRLLRALFDAASADAIDRRDAGGWCARDALAHLVDVDAGVIPERIRRILEEERPFIRSIDPHARLAAGGYEERTVGSLLYELEANRSGRAEWLRRLSDEELARAGEHDEAGEITAGDIAHQWAYHDLMHVQQIAAMLQAGLVERMGNTRKFYDV